jgi:uncharacterized protein (DUF2126 family)
MNVKRVAEHPRITKPFSDDAGRRSTRSAARSTPRWRQGDVRLTMGGEPTFVSIDDFERRRMEHRRRRPAKARAGRQADPAAARPLRAGRLSCITARASGIRAKPCRAGPSRSTGGATASRSGATPLIARRADTGADRRARPRRCSARWPRSWASSRFVAGLRGSGQWIIKEGNLPENVTPENSKLKDPEERAPHRAGVRARPDRTRGHVLPIQRWQSKARA